MSIFKACDIRGCYGTELRDEHAIRLGLALRQYCGPIDFLVGGDGRLSPPTLMSSLIAALQRSGCKTTDLGILPTPALYFARRHLGVTAAVMVTASHNPSGDNGFKLSLGPLPVSPDDIVALSRLMELESADEVGSISAAATQSHASPAASQKLNILPEYIQFASSLVNNLRGMRVVVDCANGVSALVAREVWQRAGAQSTYLFDTVDGSFPNHPPDPSKVENLKALCQAVVEQKADLGVAYDGDGDRVVFVDSKGRPLSNDQAIVLFVKMALRNGPAPIVYDQKCSLIVPETIVASGGRPVIERSGHTFIKGQFLKQYAPYAGEISGHHFFKELGGDDGVIASLYMAQLIQDSSLSLAELADAIQTYPITPDIRLNMDDMSAQRVIDDLELLEGEAQLIRLDGLRAEFQDGWGICRLSVTEPAITLRFEGKDKKSLNRIMRRFESVAPLLSGRLPVVE
jgi:phosphomannomutase / phosphoglucomutase